VTLLLLCLVLVATSGVVPLPQTVSVTQADADPDALYERRESIDHAIQAEAIWAQRLGRDPHDFEAAWKLARARYWLGGPVPEGDRRARLEAGVTAARAAIAIDPKRPEGHFWMAANMGALAESFGVWQGLKYRGAIKDALTAVLTIDPAFQHGSADRALGRWYYKVPRLFGGSKQKSEEHLRRSLEYAPQSTASLFFLAETLIDMGRKNEARAALQGVLDAPLDPEWGPEDRDFKEKARQALQQIDRD
jgi:tetratricopeptide (TPR) repeat protein